MRKFLASLAVAAMLAVPFVGNVAMADEEATLCSYCFEKGELTESNPVISRGLLLPVRVVGAGVGAPFGLLRGVAEEVPPAMSAVSAVTFEKIPTTEFDHPVTNATVTALKLPVFGATGIVGTAIALPLSAAYGAVTGTVKGLGQGFMYLDRL